ncbi:uncharacterized protein LOC143300145 [Babylonia areolata]|uniref:uncharacterized protein LOC143300145 n=1 Tax=Babylonia areolata TaxID=304850 RepID=UPI003FD051DC
MPLSGDPATSTCKSMVTQMYTFSSWSKQKSFENGHGSSSMLPYVGFPGLTLTPIPESPLLDSALAEDTADLHPHHHHLHHVGNGELLREQDEEDGSKLLHHHHHQQRPLRNGSLPRHWWLGKGGTTTAAAIPALTIEENGDVETGGGEGRGGRTGTAMTSRMTAQGVPDACAVNVRVVRTTTFLPKEEAGMTREEKRAHLCKLLLFALCGFVIVAGIVLWIFSPAFT